MNIYPFAPYYPVILLLIYLFINFQRFLGTNPICCVAPGENGDSFALDMATATVALGKVSKYLSL